MELENGDAVLETEDTLTLLDNYIDEIDLKVDKKQYQICNAISVHRSIRTLMFILTDTNSGGIYATTDNFNQKIVHLFEQEEDAERYISQLVADDYEDPLEVMEVEREVIAVNCNNYGYQYSIVTKDDLVIPPQ